jgi:DUF4097 and DUF4098 domain-containing protein YvlB
MLPILALSVLLEAPVRAEEWTKKYNVSGAPEVRVETNDGNVRIDTWDAKEIEARVETLGWRISENEVRVIERQAGDRVELEVRVPRRWYWSRGGERHWVKIELKIPRQANLSVRTGDGNVALQPLTGNVAIGTGDGDITLSGVKGEVRLATQDGRIEATSVDGRVQASSGDGNIRIEGRFELLDLHTGDGNIEAHALAGSRLAASWAVRTGDGNIVLRLPQDIQAELDLHTRDGRISLDFPVAVYGTLSQHTIRGKINGGGAMLTITTGDGSIRLER